MQLILELACKAFALLESPSLCSVKTDTSLRTLPDRHRGSSMPTYFRRAHRRRGPLPVTYKQARPRSGLCYVFPADADGWVRQRRTKGTIMSQAIMDPEKVRRFADELQRFNTDLENRLVLLQARFGALGDTWQDQEHEKFSEEFKLAMKALKKFIELSKDHTPYLLRKAQKIEEYLNQR
jgi:uncharacterized protein YukE